jgi:carbon-monoxide dehydrogenase medium subunit
MAEYLFPKSVEEAIEQLEACDGKARIIAGGTDVMADIRDGKIAPRCLVDITRVPGLDQIVVRGDFIEVGAAVSFAVIKDSPLLNQQVHALVDAARSVGAIGIQTVATWVGNIVQGMPAADGAIIALALEAEAHVVDKDGHEWRSVESLFKGPGVSAIDPTRELITHVRFPHPRCSSSPRWGTAWKRVGRRPSLVLPILNCAVKVCLDLSGEQVEYVTIALGPVAPRPLRAREAEAFLRGRVPTAETLAEAGSIVRGEANPRSSIMRASREYRLAIIPTLVGDALRVAVERARWKS